MKKLLSILGLILISFNSFSQKVENVDFNLIDNKIIIYYDLLDCESKYNYEVDIKFIDDQGNTIIPRNLTGNYGRISCGRNKKVEWDLFKEVNEFEGNYKAVVSIVRIIDHKGREITAKGGMRLVSIKEINNRVEAQFGQKLEVGTQFYVNSKRGITSTIGNAVKKVGKLEVTQSGVSNSTAIFHLNKNLTSNMVEKHLANLNLQKFRRFDIGFYTGILLGGDWGNIGFGGYLDCKMLDNKTFIGLDLGYNLWETLDLTINLGLTPYLFNSRVFSLGFEVQPIQIGYGSGNWGDDWYSDTNIGPRFGVFGGFDFKRFKIKTSLGIFNYYHYNYDSYWGEDTYDYNAPYFSIGLKFRVN